MFLPKLISAANFISRPQINFLTYEMYYVPLTQLAQLESRDTEGTWSLPSTPRPMLSPGSWEQTSGSLKEAASVWAVSLKQRFVAHGHTQKQRCICLLCLPTNLQRNKLLPRWSSRPPCAGLLLGLFVVLIEPGPCSCALSYSPRPRDRSSYERMRSPVLGGRQSGCFWAPRHC